MSDETPLHTDGFYQGPTEETVEIAIPQPKGYRCLAVIVQNTGTMYVDEEMESFVHKIHEFVTQSASLRHARGFESDWLVVNCITNFTEAGEGPGLETIKVLTYEAYLSRVGAENVAQVGYHWMPHGPAPRESSVQVARALPFAAHGPGKRHR